MILYAQSTTLSSKRLQTMSHVRSMTSRDIQIYPIQIMFVIGNQLSFAMVMRCHLMISYTSEANHTV